jgi:hypothetical protein
MQSAKKPKLGKILELLSTSVADLSNSQKIWLVTSFVIALILIFGGLAIFGVSD